MQLSVVIPAYNEGHRILTTLERVVEFSRSKLDRWEILVVDDGSTDGTAEVVSRSTDARLLRNGANRGKGYSVRHGMLEATLDPILFTDADLSTPIGEALPLMRALDAGASVAIASRLPDSGKQVRRTPHRRLMALVFRWVVKAIALRGYHDTQCGFKVFRRDAARAIFSRQRIDRWGFDVEVLYLAGKLALQVAQVPVAWQESTESRLKLTTPLTMIADLLRIRWYDVRGFYRL